MVIPKSLKIGGHVVKVVYPYVFIETTHLCGQYDDAAKEIRLSDLDTGGGKRSESSVAVTLMHEILHAIDLVSGHSVFVGQEGEKAVEGVSEGLFQVLRDNPLHFDED